MKRLSALLLSLLLAISLCACGGDHQRGQFPDAHSPARGLGRAGAGSNARGHAGEGSGGGGARESGRRNPGDLYIDARYASEDNFTGRAIYATLRSISGTPPRKSSRKFRNRSNPWDIPCVSGTDGGRWRRSSRSGGPVLTPCTWPIPSAGSRPHCRGNTVDITLVTLDGESVAMPSDFDDFSSLADRDYSDVSPEAAENARLLEELMTAAGFRPYSAEWWHYTDNDA